LSAVFSRYWKTRQMTPSRPMAARPTWLYMKAAPAVSSPMANWTGRRGAYKLMMARLIGRPSTTLMSIAIRRKFRTFVTVKTTKTTSMYAAPLRSGRPGLFKAANRTAPAIGNVA
jgi:hypothetical protein